MMSNKLFSIMEDRVSCVAAAVKTHTVCVSAVFEQVVRNLALSFVSVLKTDNNICNQVSSLWFLAVYQYRNTGSELMQAKIAVHSP